MINLVKLKKKNKSYTYFYDCCNTLYSAKLSPTKYVEQCWKNYVLKHPSENVSVNGKVFEYIIISSLMREDIQPIYTQAKVAFISNVGYDIILYSKDNFPISLSIKTSLRERYKQADLEAVALKYVHRRAKSYLINLDGSENAIRKNDIKNGNILGLNDFILATDEEYDNLIYSLRKDTYIKPNKIDIITSNNIIEK